MPVTGAGGSISHHLVTYLVEQHGAHGADLKPPEFGARKVTLARDGAEIEIWGDGQGARSYMYVGGIYRVTRSNYSTPLKLGTDELVTVDELVNIVCQIAGKKLIGPALDVAQRRADWPALARHVGRADGVGRCRDHTQDSAHLLAR